MVNRQTKQIGIWHLFMPHNPARKMLNGSKVIYVGRPIMVRRMVQVFFEQFRGLRHGCSGLGKGGVTDHADKTCLCERASRPAGACVAYKPFARFIVTRVTRPKKRHEYTYIE